MTEKETNGDSGEERAPDKEAPDRETCLKMAMGADMVGWCRKNGVPLEKEGEHFRHGGIEGLRINGRWWQHSEEKKGKLGRYTKGGLVQYLEEYEGIGVEEALQRALKFVDPQAVLPERKAELDHKRERISLKKRIRRAKKRNRGREGPG